VVYLKRLILTIKLVFSIRKPLAFLLLLRNYIKAKLVKSPVLRGVDIVLTYACNLKCKHCNISGMLQSENNPLSLDEYREIEKECTRLGVVQYTFTGGEPLLAENFEEIVKIFKPYKRIMLLQTNGALIKSYDDAIRLRKIGINVVNVSMDSGIAEEHDRNRGLAGHWEQTQKCLSYGKKAGLKTMIGTVISHNNLHSIGIKKLISYAQKNNIILLLNLAAPTGKWFKNKDVILTKEDQEYIRNLVRQNPHVRLDMDSTINQYGCPAFKEKLYITPYGDVTGCTFVPVAFGNIRYMSIEEIRKIGLRIEFMNKYSKICYAAEDHDFINQYMSQLEPPMPEHFSYLRKNNTIKTKDYTCPVCGSNKYLEEVCNGVDFEYGIEGKFNLFLCFFCGLISSIPRPSLGDLERIYPESYHAYQRPQNLLFKYLSGLNLKKRIKRYRQLLGERGRIMDVGCGDGEIMEPIQAAGYECHGLEFKKSIVRKAQEKGLKVFEGILEEGDNIKSDSYDLLIMNHLIEHFQNPPLAIKNAFRLLRKGGWICGETPNKNCRERNIFSDKWSGYHIPRHLQIFSEKNIKKLFLDNGFSKVTIKKSLNPGQLALSMQNWYISRHPKTKLSSGKARIYPFFLILSIPIVLLEYVFSSKTGIMYFEVQK